MRPQDGEGGMRAKFRGPAERVNDPCGNELDQKIPDRPSVIATTIYAGQTST